MHGRKKETQPLTSEEKNKRLNEQIKKVQIYKDTMSFIFKKRADNQLDDELLTATYKMLMKNPDIFTLWNIRREIILFKEKDQSFDGDMVKKELDFGEACLKINPKSYSAWHHRCWLMQLSKFGFLDKELQLCSQYLSYDDRNFHCWDYRKFLVDNSSDITVEQNLKFTKDKIINNFSNFSSWHLRSRLLPESGKDFFKEELELIKNAAFTDPSDQSVWFYHRWLVNFKMLESCKLVIGASTDNLVILIFNKSIFKEAVEGIEIKSEGSNLNVTSVQSLKQSSNVSNIWILIFEKSITDIIYKVEFSSETYEIPFGKIVSFSKLNPEHEAMLSGEIEWISQLYELEPENKWVTYSLLMLMKKKDVVSYQIQIEEMLNSLRIIDPMRTNYYASLERQLQKYRDAVKNSSRSAITFTLDNLECLMESVNLKFESIKSSINSYLL